MNLDEVGERDLDSIVADISRQVGWRLDARVPPGTWTQGGTWNRVNCPATHAQKVADGKWSKGDNAQMLGQMILINGVKVYKFWCALCRTNDGPVPNALVETWQQPMVWKRDNRSGGWGWNQVSVPAPSEMPPLPVPTPPTNGIKPIQTKYAGCFFRSRLEARWAVYFDTRGWPWEYEPEGFELPSGWYLPDFRVLLTQNCPHCTPPRLEWFEIKGQKPTAREIRLAYELADASDMQVTILGKIPRPGTIEEGWRARDFSSGPVPGELVGRYFSVEGGKDAEQRPEGMSDLKWLSVGGLSDDRNRNMMTASIAARSARFEHGQSG